MKHFTHGYFILLIASLSLSCGINEEGGYLEPRPVPVDSINDILIGDNEVTFSLNLVVPDPCFEYYEDTTERDGSTILTTAYARRDTREACPQVIDTLKQTINIQVSESGTYLFQFWQSEETTLDTTVTIP